MPADDAELQRRLAALEAEVKADADAQAARKAAALAKLREQQAAKLAEREAERERAARAKPARRDAGDEPGALDGAIVVAKGAKLARQAQQELGRPRAKGEKSWLVSSVASLVLGPLGWLYAGSFREAIPAGAAYLIAAAILSKLPIFLVWPVMALLLPLSAIAGLVYALQYNRNGHRTRIFDKDKDAKKLPPGT